MTQSQTTQNTSTSVFGSFMAKTKPVASPEVKEEKDSSEIYNYLFNRLKN